MLIRGINPGHNLLRINAHRHILNKNTYTTFGSGADSILDEKVENFTNDLIALVNEKPNIKHKDIQELIRKTTGEHIGVRPCGEMEGLVVSGGNYRPIRWLLT